MIFDSMRTTLSLGGKNMTANDLYVKLIEEDWIPHMGIDCSAEEWHNRIMMMISAGMIRLPTEH